MGGAFQAELDALLREQQFDVVQTEFSHLGPFSLKTRALKVVRAGLFDTMLAARNQLLGMSAQNPLLTGVRPNGLEDMPEYHIDIDQEKASALGLSIADINSTLGTVWGSTYVNDFIDKGRVKKVYLQGDAPFRAKPDDINNRAVLMS